MVAPHHKKYPRTRHLPWSPGASDDDLWFDLEGAFAGRRVVITEKMDGENTSMYRDHLHARSLDTRHHPSRDWIKRFHGQMAHLIPQAWRVCGENLYARHSIAYDALPSYFMAFSIWDEDNRCLSWEQTREWAALLGVELVPVRYEGLWDEALVRELEVDTERSEGYVVRDAGAFGYEEFGQRVAKWVRAGHVQTDSHWMHRAVVPNGLAAP